MRSLRIVLGAFCLLASARLTHGKKNEQTPPAATGSNPKTKTMGTAGHHVRVQDPQPILSPHIDAPVEYAAVIRLCESGFGWSMQPSSDCVNLALAGTLRGSWPDAQGGEEEVAILQPA